MNSLKRQVQQSKRNEGGRLRLELLKRDETFIRREKSGFITDEEVCRVELVFEPENNGHLKILQNYTDHILKGEELIAPGYEGINSLTISNAAYLSSWKRHPVKLPFDKKLFLSELKKQKDLDKSHETGMTVSEEDDYASRWQVRW